MTVPLIEQYHKLELYLISARLSNCFINILNAISECDPFYTVSFCCTEAFLLCQKKKIGKLKQSRCTLPSIVMNLHTSSAVLFGLLITCMAKMREKWFGERKQNGPRTPPSSPLLPSPFLQPPVIEVRQPLPLWPANVIASEQSP